MDRNTEQIDEKIGQMLGSLDRVEAPADFAMRVKARIAVEKAERVSGPFWRLVRIGAPILALLTIAVVFWIFDSAQPSELNVAVAEPESREFLEPVIENTSLSVNATRPQSNASPAVARDERAPQTRNPPKDAKRPEKGGGSKDFAVRGGNPKSPERSGVAPGFDTQTRIPVRDVLSDLGIESRSEGGKLVVTSVKANSVAERSGIETGDAIDAIDDKMVSPGTVFLKSATGANLTVVRRGARLILPLR
jgi:S1-C subfamily serine protease